ncbi:MAG: D-glycero-beta-D-manno-heptose 1-phosphate adenylyltransferase [Deltaproteobacteria bacterium]|nr:D-glycero-beta-D-manno-heptose 1-phosphate adenylyltransferase [Deltaproteobacteria bacterium]
MSLRDKIKDLQELKKAIEFHRKKYKKIVFTNGCYDLIHIGHVRCFREAKRLGDILIVALNSDRSVRSIKDPPRPIIPQEERAEIVSSMENVDYVTIFDQDDPRDIIASVKPDILVKGGDWNLNTIVGREIVESYGGKVFALPLVPDVSTTQIIKIIASHYSEEKVKCP